MVSYKEIAKPADEILDKQFVHTKPWAVDLRHKLDNPSLKLTGHLNGDGNVQCASSCALSTGAFTVNGLLGIDGSAGMQLTYNSDLFCKGLTLQTNVTSAIKTVREQHVELQAKYERDPWRIHATMTPLNRKWGLALVGKHTFQGCGHTIQAGADISGTRLTPPTLSGAGIGYSYPIKNQVIGAAVYVSPYGADQLGKITVSVTSQTSNLSELAARYTYIPSEDRGESCIGAGWILDSKTKLTSLKARIDNNANIAAAFTHKLNESASVTVGVGFDGSRKIDSENPTKVGVKLNLTA